LVSDKGVEFLVAEGLRNNPRISSLPDRIIFVEREKEPLEAGTEWKPGREASNGKALRCVSR
jgi:hypothetical protein